MIRKFTLVYSLLILAAGASAQIYDPVSWEFGFEKKGGKEYELIFTATIDDLLFSASTAEKTIKFITKTKN